MTEKQINLLLNVSDVTRSEIIEAFPEMEEVFKREDEEWEAERQRAHDAWVAAGKPPRVGLLDFQPVLKTSTTT